MAIDKALNPLASQRVQNAADGEAGLVGPTSADQPVLAKPVDRGLLVLRAAGAAHRRDDLDSTPPLGLTPMNRARVSSRKLDGDGRPGSMTGRPRVPSQGLGDAPLARHPIEPLTGRSSRWLGAASPPSGPHGPPLAAERSPSSEVPRASAGRSRRSLRRSGLILGVGAVVITVVVTLRGAFGNDSSFPVPSEATLAGLSVPQRIVAVSESQVGYSTEPSNSYCNKFSAYWDAGTGGCPSGETAEEWCADFAAWAWQKAGVNFTYGYGSGEINGAAASFYEWAIAYGQWHPATSGYVAAPGDVAVYGLSVGADPSAAHVAIVTDDAPGQAGPDVVNGDGDRTGFSVVETGTNQLHASADQQVSTLAGYVSPP
jgi:hypothetical protein